MSFHKQFAHPNANENDSQYDLQWDVCLLDLGHFEGNHWTCMRDQLRWSLIQEKQDSTSSLRILKLGGAPAKLHEML